MTGTASGRRIGALATASGLTVRTLHHYDEIGLLVPSERTAAGHRLYSDDDVQRLYRICLLRRLGLALPDIARALEDAAWGLRPAIAAHLAELEARLLREQRLRARLARLVATIDPEEGAADDLLDVLEDMTMLDSAAQARISVLVYADVEAAFGYLVDAFGLGPGELTRDGSGTAVLGELHAGDGVVWLHPESSAFGLASPRTLGAATASVAVLVDDVDAHWARARARGATIAYDPVDQPYGYREYGARDQEGHLWSFMKAIDA
jgi:DNA-binding transcriptional MerR regulator